MIGISLDRRLAERFVILRKDIAEIASINYHKKSMCKLYLCMIIIGMISNVSAILTIKQPSLAISFLMDLIATPLCFIIGKKLADRIRKEAVKDVIARRVRETSILKFRYRYTDKCIPRVLLKETEVNKFIYIIYNWGIWLVLFFTTTVIMAMILEIVTKLKP